MFLLNVAVSKNSALKLYRFSQKFYVVLVSLLFVPGIINNVIMTKYTHTAQQFDGTLL